jgi:hypothetical protein
MRIVSDDYVAEVDPLIGVLEVHDGWMPPAHALSALLLAEAFAVLSSDDHAAHLARNPEGDHALCGAFIRDPLVPLPDDVPRCRGCALLSQNLTCDRSN